MTTITYIPAIILGALQGLTELFPISSLGHSVIVPTVFGWNIDQNAPYFLVFLVATHFATALILFIFFFKDWMRIIGGILRSLVHWRIEPGDTYTKLGWLLVVATVPAGLLGLLLQKKLGELFAAPLIAAIFLVLNGLVLFLAEYFRKRKERKSANASAAHDDAAVAKMSWKQSFSIGIAQCLALIPGFSRTGVTLCGGLVSGLDHENSARFSFLLATPIIGAAAFLKLPELFSAVNRPELGAVLAGALAAAIAAYLSVKFLIRYFRTRTLVPFATYCVVAGLAFTLILTFK